MNILGNINIVIFSPDDIEILKSGPAKKEKISKYIDKSIKTQICILFKYVFKTLEQKK